MSTQRATTRPPGGTVTFLVTDIEDSTPLYDTRHAAMRVANRRHMAILDDAIAAHRGYHFKTIGDAYQVAFASPHDALAAALAAHRALLAEDWSELGALRVRLALHTGEAEPEFDARQGLWDYPPTKALIPATRLLGACRGNQLLLTEATARLVQRDLPPGVALPPRGAYYFKGLARPERIFQVALDGQPLDVRPLKALRVGNLGATLTPLIGREDEVAAVAALLRARPRLLTLVGPGGIGKTRLALAAVEEAADAFGDGAWFVDLAPVADPALVLPSIAATLGIRETATLDLRATLLAALAGDERLLLLDNCEQVLAAGADLRDLLAACPNLTILATSRARLNLQAEQVRRVPGLDLPPPDAAPDTLATVPAVALFVERARAVRPDFALTPANAAAVVAICRQLAGIPLAIRLAAAWAHTLAPQEIRADLADLLTDGGLDDPDRQRTLAATLDWSHTLLPADAQRLFARSAIFDGGATLEALGAVCNPEAAPRPRLLAALRTLVDHSLLDAASGAAGATRYAMLEPVRQYAAARLTPDEHPALAAAHTAHFLAFADAADQELQGPNQAARLAQLAEEHPNLRAVLHRAREAADWATSLRLGGALARFWDRHGHWREGRAWLQEALPHAQALPPAVRGRASLGLSWFLDSLGEPAAARSHAQAAHTLAEQADDRPLFARAALQLGILARDQGDYAEARRLYEASLDIDRALGDRAGEGASLNNLGTLAHAQGDYAEARRLYGEALAIFRALGRRPDSELAERNLARLGGA